MEEVRIHPRVTTRHKEIQDADVHAAWRNAIAFAERRTDEKDFFVAIGFDRNGRLLEIVASRDEDGVLVVFHAMTPPSRKTLRELGLSER